MKNARTTIWVMAVVLSVASSPVLAMVHFRDGRGHLIHYEINEDVWVDWQAPWLRTTVKLYSGGIIYPHDLQADEDSIVNIVGGAIGDSLYAFARSQVNMSGGSIGYDLNAYDSSQVDISGGEIGNSMTTWGSSLVDISGGSIGFDLTAWDSSQVNVSGGSIGRRLHAYGYSQVSFSGGSIGSSLEPSHGSQVSFSGGSIGSMVTTGRSQVDISGGSIGDDLLAYDRSQVDISGGSIGKELRLSNWSIVTILGSDFAVDSVPFGYGELTSIFGGSNWDEPYRHLSGTLASGEPINNAFYIGHDAKIVLGVTPAPSAILLGSIGVGLVGWLRTRRTL